MTAVTRSPEDLRPSLSALWVFVLINMLFADIFSFMVPGNLRQLVNGEAVEGLQTTPGLLLAAAVLTEVSIAMVILARFLGHQASRWANVLGGGFTILWVVGGGSATPPYVFFAAIEILTCLVIIGLAWKWRRP